ncbi:hypothetical protein D3C78_589370 [compost metagenome]
MAGSDLDAAIHIEMEGSEIHLVRPGHAQVEHIAASVHEPIGQSGFQRRARQAHITTGDHFPGPQELGIGTTDAVGDIFVEFVAESATDVIGLETSEEHRHSLD